MRAVICGILAATLLTGCATGGTAGASRAKTKASMGALLGGIAGATVAILKGKEGDEVLASAAAGAVAGAVAGYTLGRAQDRRLASRDDAIARYAYDARRGPLLDLQSVELSPATISAGSTAQIKVVYTVLSPGQYETIPISYTTSLYHDGEQILDLGQQRADVEDGGGTVEVTFPFTVPAGAAHGTYELRTDISLSSGPSDWGSRSFYVS